MLKFHKHQNQQERQLFSDQICPFYHDVYRYLLSLGADDTLAEDFAQDTMLKAWEKREELLNVDYQKEWLIKVARNRYVSHWRSAERRFRYDVSDFALTERQCEEAEQDALEIFMKQESGRAVRAAMQLLDPKYAQPIRLRYFGEMSHREIAGLLRINPNTVRSIISRGLRKLRHLLQESDF